MKKNTLDSKTIFLSIFLDAQKFMNRSKSKQSEGNGSKQFKFQNYPSEKFDQFQMQTFEEHPAKLKVFQMLLSWWSFGDKMVR